MKFIDAVLYALKPGHAARAAKAKADSERFREGLKWLLASRAFKESVAREVLPA